jgi:hypothetical protein
MTPEETERQIQEQRAAQAKSLARQMWKKFLETTAPNVAVTIENLLAPNHPQARTQAWSTALPEVDLHCEACDGRRIFATDAEYLFPGDWRFVKYQCKNCGRQAKIFAVIAMQAPRNSVLTTAQVMKLGEYPPFSAPISTRIAKLLGDQDLELYRKGTRAEAQGLGIGAATYFRRIVDNQWQLLVRELREAALKVGVKDVAIYDAALKETQFSNAVKMLKDAIPGKLLILDGENPLTLLYRPLSVQLHGLTDQQCLQQAADIRLVLTAMLENIADVLKDHNELRDAASRLKQIGS